LYHIKFVSTTKNDIFIIGVEISSFRTTELFVIIYKAYIVLKCSVFWKLMAVLLSYPEKGSI